MRQKISQRWGAADRELARRRLEDEPGERGREASHATVRQQRSARRNRRMARTPTLSDPNLLHSDAPPAETDVSMPMRH